MSSHIWSSPDRPVDRRKSARHNEWVRTHGWAGLIPPADDDEAAKRIIAAAGELMESGATDVNIRQVAQKLGIARQTVYRYFPNSQALLVATAQHATNEFLDSLTRALEGLAKPSHAIVEAIALTFERLRENRRFALLFTEPETTELTAEVTAAPSIAIGRVIVDHLSFDWGAHGWTDADMNELVEVMLRFVQSLLVDPGDPPRSPEELRAFLHRWVGTAIEAKTPTSQSAARTQP